jgi:hypothetical protein
MVKWLIEKLEGLKGRGARHLLFCWSTGKMRMVAGERNAKKGHHRKGIPDIRISLLKT